MLAERNPEAYLPDVVVTLINLVIFYLKAVPDKEKSVKFAMEVLKIAQQFPDHYMVQQYEKIAFQVLLVNGVNIDDLIEF